MSMLGRVARAVTGTVVAAGAYVADRTWRSGRVERVLTKSERKAARKDAVAEAMGEK